MCTHTVVHHSRGVGLLQRSPLLLHVRAVGGDAAQYRREVDQQQVDERCVLPDQTIAAQIRSGSKLRGGDAMGRSPVSPSHLHSPSCMEV